MTSDSIPDQRCPRAVYGAVAVVALGGFVFGYDYAVIAGAIFDIRLSVGSGNQGSEP